MSPSELKQFIIDKAYTLGFSHVGIADPLSLEDQGGRRLSQWLDKGYHATMHWMKTRSAERSNVQTYYPDIKSVISLSMNYFTGDNNKHASIGKVSNYAWGDDYHGIIKPRLNELLNIIQSKISNVKGLVCIDTAPIMEKVWAQNSGLGWIGKHTNLITRDYGSWVFLGEILLNIELEYDSPFTEDLCGTCTACLDACPTNAFPEPYVLDASKCISYLTIEHKGNLPINMENKLSGWIYGCDICQEVCPWNIKFSQCSNEILFQERENIREKELDKWNELTEDEFKILFKNSAVKRTKFKGLKRNIEATNNTYD